MSPVAPERKRSIPRGTNSGPTSAAASGDDGRDHGGDLPSLKML
jgi:hypothetical protein